MRTFVMMALTAGWIGLAGCGERGTAASEPAAGDAKPAAEAGASAGETAAVDSLPQVDLAALRQIVADTAAQDRVLVIDFWATWCEPCKALFPHLKKGLEPFGDEIRKITVTLDTPGKYEQKAIEFLAQHHATADAYLLDPDGDEQERVVDELGDQWNALVVPAILVFDRDGELAGEFFGADAEPIVARVRELTADSGQGG